MFTQLTGAGAYVMKNRYSVEATTSKPPSSRHARGRKVGGGSSNNNDNHTSKSASKSQILHLIGTGNL